MKTGALLFAHNNQVYNYVALAEWTAQNIHRHLNIPVTLVTDKNVEVSPDVFDQVIRIDSGLGSVRHFQDANQSAVWYNDSRVQCYDLSPYDRTLVIDTDYVVASPILTLPLSSSVEFLCHKKAQAIGLDQDWDANYFGLNRFPMSWATVMIFSKTPAVKFIFDSMKMVQRNWQHYKDLYRVGKMYYRNDYALSIALGLYTGHSQVYSAIPWNLTTALPDHTVQQEHHRDAYMIQHQSSSGRWHSVSLESKDFHAMCKKSLGGIVEAHRRTRLSNSCL